MLKRLFDFVASFCGLLCASPVLVPTMIAVWWQDKHSPFYVAPRVGEGESLFKMIKLRSMIVQADKTGVNSTGANDRRITAVGHFIRRYKLDELTQLWNVLIGDMSLVGPRPNVKAETDMYTLEEKKMLSVKPGITDLASIVFSDEGDILKGRDNPDLAYNQLIRPWKSRLALVSMQNSSVVFDFKVIILTAMAIVSRRRALEGVVELLKDINADAQIIEVAKRERELTPFPPPGAAEIVTQIY